MYRRRALFLTTLTAATLAGAAAVSDATSYALTGRHGDLSTANDLDALLFGAVLGQVVGLFLSMILLGIAEQRRRPFHAVVGAAWGAAAGAVGLWIPVFVAVGSSAAC